MFNNKKADEPILSIWNFVIWGIIGLGLVIVIINLNPINTDIRKIQADLLADRIGNCITDYKITEKFISDDFNLFKECNIDKKGFDNNKFYFNITTRKAGSNEVLRKEIVFGNPDFEIMCGIKRNADSPNFAKCNIKEFFGIYNNEQIIIKVMAGSNNAGGGV